MKRILFYIFIILTSLWGCKDNGTDYPPENNLRYPDKLNRMWEYYTIFQIEYYDSTGSIFKTDTLFTASSFVKVISISDSLGDYKDLTVFESYGINSEVKGTTWYLNSDNSFSVIAYYNPAFTQWVLPKSSGTKRRYTLEEIKTIFRTSGLNKLIYFNTINSDSIQYHNPPRKVLEYPLYIGKSWTEISNQDFVRQRYVSSIENIIYNGMPVQCYLIKINWPQFNDIQINDFISLNMGLIKREIFVDSLVITSIENPDSIGLARVSEFSNLVRMSE
jgi:hypothetical protein